MHGRVAIAVLVGAAGITLQLYRQAAAGEPAMIVDAAIQDAPPDTVPPDAGTSDAVIAGVTEDASSVEVARSPQPVTDVRMYLTSQFEVSVGERYTQPFERVSLGASFRRFPRGGGPPLEVRLGITAYASADIHTVYHREASGVGGELEIVPRELGLPIGLRLGVESSPTISGNAGDYTPILLTAGARIYLHRNAFLAADLFHFANTDPAFELDVWTTTGCLLGIGFTGSPGGGDQMTASSRKSTRVQPVPDQHAARHRALEYLDDAAHAARRGDCATVETIGARVRTIDASFYTTVFRTDPFVALCQRTAGPAADTQRAVRQRAWAYLDDATRAALRGDCATVETIAAQVREIDADFYTTIFSVDQAVVRCTPLLRDAGAADDDAGAADAGR